MARTLNLALIPGDGIGTEVVVEALKVLDAVKGDMTVTTQEYDLGAHVPIVLEAGGRFTDIDGIETISTRSSLATNGRLHDAFLAELPPVG